MLKILDHQAHRGAAAAQEHREKLVGHRKAIGRYAIERRQHPACAPLVQWVQPGAAGHAQAVNQERVRVLRQYVRKMLVLFHLAAQVVNMDNLRLSADGNDRLAGHARGTDVR